MSSSVKKSRTPEALTETIPAGELAFAREYFRNLIFQEILLAFKAGTTKDGLTKAKLARRLRRGPEQITRWLSSPGNIEVDSLSDLLMAMGTRPESILCQRARAEASPAVKALAQQPEKDLDFSSRDQVFSDLTSHLKALKDLQHSTENASADGCRGALQHLSVDYRNKAGSLSQKQSNKSAQPFDHLKQLLLA